MSKMSLTEKAILVGMYLSKYDKRALGYLNFSSFHQVFYWFGEKLNRSPATIKNYRDEFDPLFPNKRLGWKNRKIRPYVKITYDKYNELDLISFTNILRDILYKDRQLPKCDIFENEKIYALDELENIANLNGMSALDCIDDELMVSLGGDNGENVFEFNMIAKDEFKLRWFDLDWRKLIVDDF